MCFVYKSQIKFSFISIGDLSMVIILPVYIVIKQNWLESLLNIPSSSALKIKLHHMHLS